MTTPTITADNRDLRYQIMRDLEIEDDALAEKIADYLTEGAAAQVAISHISCPDDAPDGLVNAIIADLKTDHSPCRCELCD